VLSWTLIPTPWSIPSVIINANTQRCSCLHQAQSYDRVILLNVNPLILMLFTCDFAVSIRIMNVFYINNQTPDGRVLLDLFSSYEQCLAGHCLSFFSFFHWPMYCLPFFNLLRLITTLVSSNFSPHLHYSI
jgi:hypothetical protein